MMARIKEAEHTQRVAELKQKISRLELKVSPKCERLRGIATIRKPELIYIYLFLVRITKW